MKEATVIIESHDLAAGVTTLLDALEPDDLPALAGAIDRLSAFHAMAERLFGAAPPPDPNADLVAELEHQKNLNTVLAERVAAQSELLSQRAEKPKMTVVRQFFEGPPVVEEPEDDDRAESDAHKELHAPQVRPGSGANMRERCRLNRLAVCRALEGGPLTQTEIMRAVGIKKGTMSTLMNSGTALGAGWWKKTDPDDKWSPYELTEAGRAALAAEGYVVAPAKSEPVQPKRPPVVTDRTRERCRLVAQEIDRAGVALAAITIAMNSKLEYADVKQLLLVGDYFVRANRPGEYYGLTAAGRELAREEVPV